MTADAYHAKRPAYAELDEAGRALFDAITGGPRATVPGQFELRSADGSLTGPFGLFLLSPALGMPLQQLGAQIRSSSVLPDRERELVTLGCAAATRCTFELVAHIPLALNAGVGGDEIDTVLRGGTLPSSREDAFVKFARANVFIADPRDEFEALRAVADDREMFEVIAITGYYRTLASMLELLGSGSTEGVPHER